MKTNQIKFALALFSGAVLTAQADKVRIEQLPPDVQTKIRAQTGAATIDDIDREVKNGQTVYEVGFKKDEQQKELVFNQQGDLLNSDATPVLDSRKVTWNDLPEAVKSTAQTRLNAASVDDIDRQVKDGKISYEIGFKQGNEQKELLISDDGKILRDVQVPQALVSGVSPTPVPGTVPSSTAASRFTRPLTLAEVQVVPMNWAPETVQALINQNASGAPITKFEKGKWRGRTIYQSTYQLNGQSVRFQIGEDGKVVYDPRSPTAVGVPAAGVSGTASSQLSNTLVPLSSAEKVDRRSVPAGVERAIQIYAANNPVEDIDRGAWRGRNIYQIAFKDNGQHVEVQVDENGNLVYDPRTVNR